MPENDKEKDMSVGGLFTNSADVCLCDKVTIILIYYNFLYKLDVLSKIKINTY